MPPKSAGDGAGGDVEIVPQADTASARATLAATGRMDGTVGRLSPGRVRRAPAYDGCPSAVAVTKAIRIRRAFRGRLRFVVPILVVTALLHGSQPTVGGEPALSPNLLDRPMADLAILASPDPETTPLLLILDAESRSPSVARLALLRRDAAWMSVASTEVDLGADDLTARWLVGLDDDSFALIATSPQSAPSTGRAVVVGLAVDEQAGAVRIDEQNRQTFDRAIEDAGAADVDGFGSAELVLGMRPIDSLDSCETSTLVVVDGSIVSVRRSIEIPGPRGAGVLGRLDAAPGAELLIYTSPGCPPSGDFRSSLLAIRLADGSQSRPVGIVRHDFVTTLPPPMLVDLDGSAPDEVIATGEAGLAVFDPLHGWRSLVVAQSGSIPVVAGPTGQPGLSGVRVAIVEPFGAAFLTTRLRRDEGTLVWTGRSEIAIDAMDPLRWSILFHAIEAAGTHQAPPNAWIGDAYATGCPDVVLPGAIVPCGTDEPHPGPAWLATLPIAAVTIGRERLILVAAGLGWPNTGFPATPTPAATGPVGWWRHGPSAPFALSEITPAELVGLDAVPTPVATIEATTAADGMTELPGPTGTRFFVTMVPLADGQQRRLPPTDAFLALTAQPLRDGRKVVVRVPVPPGAGSRRTESSSSLAIGDLRLPDDQPVSAWAMRVVPLNDVGEWGQPVSGTITYDDIAPTVVIEEPFTSPIWPFSADIVGRSEAGTTVSVDGFGEVEVDARGAFAIDTQLAPWPQSFRVTATDPAGNQTAGTFSVVGGIDYRRFPWPGILTVGLLALVAARGWFGGEGLRASSVGAARSASGSPGEDLSMPVIEELPPGSGLSRR
jgi:hypothetical protein